MILCYDRHDILAGNAGCMIAFRLFSTSIKLPLTFTFNSASTSARLSLPPRLPLHHITSISPAYRMSTTTAPSYLDDGISFRRRLPRPTHQPHPAPSSTSAYTGSYIDDGLDLLPPISGHGFGNVDRRFYRHRRRRHKKEDGAEDGGVWSKDIARAVTGDVQRSLGKLRELGSIGVRRPTNLKRDKLEAERIRRRKEQERRGVVAVPKPLRWGVFVIKEDNGRVVVVDEKGEWDSGPIGGAEDKGIGEREMKRGTEETQRWVRAASTISADMPPFPASSVHEKAVTATFRTYKHEDEQHNRPHHARSHHHKPSTPVLNSEYDSDPNDPVTLSCAASPTDFFMTGGLSGWPSRTASPVKAEPVVPHAITWETTAPGGSVSGYSYAKPMAESKAQTDLAKEWMSTSSSSSSTSKRTSSTPYHLRSPPVEANPTRGLKSTRRRRSSVSIFELKNASAVKSPAYQSPDFVEVTYDETPPGEASYSWPQTGWDGGDAASVRSLEAEREHSEASVWDTVSISTTQRKHHERDPEDLGWNDSARGSPGAASIRDEETASSRADSMTRSVHSWTASVRSQNSRTYSRAEDWDGYERPKSRSEVVVCGGSAHSRSYSHSSLGSQDSWSASHRSRQSYRAYTH